MVVTVNLITDSFYLYGSYTSSSRTQNAFMHWSVYDFCSAVVFDFLYNFNGFFVCMCVCVFVFSFRVEYRDRRKGGSQQLNTHAHTYVALHEVT